MSIWKLILFAILIGIVEEPHVKGSEMKNVMQRYIDEYKHGIDFSIDEAVNAIVIGGTVRSGEMFMLKKELVSGTSDVREKLVQLLERMGLALDKPDQSHLPVIRDRSIMRSLLTEGFAKQDAAARAAAKVLRERCLPSDLAEFAEVYQTSLQQKKGEYLYIVAKAKTLELSSLVEAMANLPGASEPYEKEKIAIAQAALGNLSIERQYIEALNQAARNAPPAPANRFYDVTGERDGKEVAKKLSLLGLIGTRNALSAACTFLRSPLKTYVPNYNERSIRFDVLDAIRYNFPDVAVLARPTDRGTWARIEQFCTDKLGVSFDGPTPDPVEDRMYPTRVLPPR